MPANTRELRSRIRSVDSTLHLTKAMELVASSKIRKATLKMHAGREYADAVTEAIKVLSGCQECRISPYMRKNTASGDAQAALDNVAAQNPAVAPERIRLIVIAGDRGMAGGYNVNVFREAQKYPDAEIYAIGRKACARYGQDIRGTEQYSYAEAVELAKQFCADFRKGEYDRLGILYTKYVSMMTQTAEVHWVFPLTAPEEAAAQQVIFEPDAAEVLSETVPLYVTGILMAAVRESYASEVSARSAAMNSAGRNAQKMMDDLRLAYNRARQGAITQELTEIVAGAGEG